MHWNNNNGIRHYGFEVAVNVVCPMQRRHMQLPTRTQYAKESRDIQLFQDSTIQTTATNTQGLLQQLGLTVQRFAKSRHSHHFDRANYLQYTSLVIEQCF